MKPQTVIEYGVAHAHSRTHQYALDYYQPTWCTASVLSNMCLPVPLICECKWCTLYVATTSGFVPRLAFESSSNSEDAASLWAKKCTRSAV